jgi:hypothetical protein
MFWNNESVASLDANEESHEMKKELRKAPFNR